MKVAIIKLIAPIMMDFLLFLRRLARASQKGMEMMSPVKKEANNTIKKYSLERRMKFTEYAMEPVRLCVTTWNPKEMAMYPRKFDCFKEDFKAEINPSDFSLLT